LDSLDLFKGAFSVSSVILTVLLLLLGFLLYCALAAIGGALASKTEDLGATNVLFVLVLVVSFLAALSLGLESKNATLLSFIPFTAVLTTPSQVLLGQLAWWQGALSAVLVALFVGALLWLAAKIYRLMAFYRGNPPSFKKLFSMLKKEKH
jgi:ABC-2 type transport system permease protein